MRLIKGTCLDENCREIKGIIGQYNEDSKFGIPLKDIIKEYKNEEGTFQCGGNKWQYRFPYLRKIPKAELALMLWNTKSHTNIEEQL